MCSLFDYILRLVSGRCKRCACAQCIARADDSGIFHCSLCFYSRSIYVVLLVVVAASLHLLFVYVNIFFSSSPLCSSSFASSSRSLHSNIFDSFYLFWVLNIIQCFLVLIRTEYKHNNIGNDDNTPGLQRMSLEKEENLLRSNGVQCTRNGMKIIKSAEQFLNAKRV